MEYATAKQWARKYADQRTAYEEYTERLHDLLNTLIQEHKGEIVQLDKRTKTTESFYTKLSTPGVEYKNPLNDITDLVGLRVVTYYRETVEQIGELIEKQFKVDWPNSIDKAEALAADQFGYLSVHYVVLLSDQRKQLEEWSRFRDLKAEIQVRSVCQHAWAVISRELNYRPDRELPDRLKRKLFRMSALLEVADEQFSELRAASGFSQKTRSAHLEMNLSSLLVYLDSMEHWHLLDVAQAVGFVPMRHTTDDEYRGMLELFNLLRVGTLDDLHSLLTDARMWGKEVLRQLRTKLNGLAEINYRDIITVLLLYSRRQDVDETIVNQTDLSPEMRNAVVGLLEQWRSVGSDQERQFLRVAGKPSLRLGKLNLQCKLMPEDLWTATSRYMSQESDVVPQPDNDTRSMEGAAGLYRDDPEAKQRIFLEWVENSLPEQLLSKLAAEVADKLEAIKKGSTSLPETEVKVLEEVHRRLNEGSNAYPRLVALPEVDQDSTLRVPIGPSRYGIALIEERKVRIPTADQLRGDYILNSLAVRVAYAFERDGGRWLEFHQRGGGPNATYKEAWDVGAAGYVDPQRHRDPEDPLKISPWQACAHELSEELGIPIFELPHRDHYYFFGVGRNDPTGQLDILALCESPFAPDPARPLTARVRAFDRCLLDPKSVASFVESKCKWVPTAILTLILTLEAVGFSRSSIEAVFSTLAGKLDLDP